MDLGRRLRQVFDSKGFNFQSLDNKGVIGRLSLALPLESTAWTCRVGQSIDFKELGKKQHPKQRWALDNSSSRQNLL
jgi:hypothetical protein